jgi:hypothetical protein
VPPSLITSACLSVRYDNKRHHNPNRYFPNLSHNPIHLPWRPPHRPSSRTRFRFPGNRVIINMGISPLACHSVDPTLARFSKQAQRGSFYYSRQGSDFFLTSSARDVIDLWNVPVESSFSSLIDKPSPPLPIDLID